MKKILLATAALAILSGCTDGKNDYSVDLSTTTIAKDSTTTLVTNRFNDNGIPEGTTCDLNIQAYVNSGSTVLECDGGTTDVTGIAIGPATAPVTNVNTTCPAAAANSKGYFKVNYSNCDNNVGDKTLNTSTFQFA